MRQPFQISGVARPVHDNADRPEVRNETLAGMIPAIPHLTPLRLINRRPETAPCPIAGREVNRFQVAKGKDSKAV